MQKGGLNSHVASVHEGKKPFKCEICTATFMQKGGLNSNVALIHEGKKHSHVTFIVQILLQNQFVQSVHFTELA